MQSFFILRFLSGRDSVQSHRPIPSRHRSHLFGKLETFSTITLHGAGCFVSKAMARICISAKSIFPPVVEKLLMVAGASPALVSPLLIHGDQFRVVRCLAFGLPVPHSPRSGQFCVLLCNPVTAPVSPRCALLRVHHQVSGPGTIRRHLQRSVLFTLTHLAYSRHALKSRSSGPSTLFYSTQNALLCFATDFNCRR